MKKAALLLIILLTCTTCKKTFYKVELSGKVLDNYTGQPIAGIKVYFLGGNVSLSSSGPGYYEKTHATTDSKGSFSFKFNANDNDAYALKPEYDKYTYLFDQNGNDRPVEVNIKKKFFKEKITQNIYLKKYSNLIVRFKQVTTDTIYAIGIYVQDNQAMLKMANGNVQLLPGYMADFTTDYIYYGKENTTIHFVKVLATSYNQTDTTYSINISKTEPTNLQINY